MRGGMDEPEIALVESIYDALDGGMPERALELARAALAGSEGEDPVLRFLVGRALIELDRPAEAAAELGRAVELDPDDSEFRADLAEALFMGCRFSEAHEHAKRAVELDGALADAHYLLALCLERRGEPAAADRHFAWAAKLEPDRFPPPCRVSAQEFARQLERARAELPPQFREHLEHVGLIVQDLPAEELLREDEPWLNPELLGLFSGVPVDGQSYLGPGGELPARIYLFQRNLERTVTCPDELAEQIRVTLFHELGHYLGMDEEELDGAGYA